MYQAGLINYSYRERKKNLFSISKRFQERNLVDIFSGSFSLITVPLYSEKNALEKDV